MAVAHPEPARSGATFQQEYALRELGLKYQLRNRVALIFQIAVPLIPIIFIAKAFAGKQTEFTIGVSIFVSVTLTGLAVAGNIVLKLQLRAQGAELRRVRRLVNEHEMRQGLPPTLWN